MKLFRSLTDIKPYRKFVRRIPYGAYLTGVDANGNLNWFITTQGNVFYWSLK